MIRVMLINQGELFGGVSAMLLNFYRHLDKNRVQYDFVAPKKTSFTTYRDEIEQMGGRIIELQSHGNIIKRKLMFWMRLKKCITKERYEVVHVNSGSVFFNIQCALIAKICHVKKIIVHSHNAGGDGILKQTVSQLVKPILSWCATDYWACSYKAASFMFTKNCMKNKSYVIINNGIDTEQFLFTDEKRSRVRTELHLQNEETLLHVGRFTRQKNHKFLIQCFKEYVQLHQNAILLLAGSGELEDEIKNQVNELGLRDSVYFLGMRQDIPEIMSAADVFVLPSLYEGLPVVGIEAQASGLPCVFSNQITEEVDVLKTSVFLPLSQEPSKWCEKIHQQIMNHSARTEAAKTVADLGYSIQKIAHILERKYLS